MSKKKSNRIPEIDAYIAKAPLHARPILSHLRELFHKASPEIEEAIKWGCPHFTYKGMLGGTAAFKNHVGFGFWKSKLMQDPAKLFGGDPKASMCRVKITDIDQLPSDKVLLSYIQEAMALNDSGAKVPNMKKPRPPLKTPRFLSDALKSNAKAKATFDGFPPSHRRDYIEWLTEAKTDATRQKRLATTLQWLAEGKSRNWKYERKRG